MPNQHTAYSPAELAWLRAHYATAPRADVLAAVPGRAWSAIQNQACKLKCSGREKFIPKMKVSEWTPDRVALLLALYPSGGSAAVSAATGLSREAVRMRAWRLRLAYVSAGKPAPKPRPTPKAPAPPKARAPRPVVEKAAAAPLLAVRRSAATPVLNVAKEARKRAEQSAKKSVSITADEIRQLPANHPARHAYAMGGARGWQQWNAQQAA